jgi:hypothetical protein
MAAIEDSVDVSSRSSQGRGARRRSRRSRHTCYSRRSSRRPGANQVVGMLAAAAYNLVRMARLLEHPA